MAQVALYRELRPRSFGQVVDQDAVVRTLRRQVSLGTPAHAYLFCGPRGTGKTTTARLLARALCCREPVEGDACGQCSACEMTTDGHPDIIEFDAASNSKVDEMRGLLEAVRYAPVGLRYKIYIIDEVHMLSTSAFNAMLKTLEEPPAHAVFMMCTTELHKVPATVLSRCLRFEMRRLALPSLEAGVVRACAARDCQIEPAAARLLARAADGAMRDAQSLSEQACLSCPNPITAAAVADMLGGADATILLGWAGDLLQNDLPAALTRLDSLTASGRDPSVLCDDLAALFRDIMLAATLGPAAADLLEQPEEIVAEYRALKADTARCVAAMDALQQAQGQMRWHPMPRHCLELALARLCGYGPVEVQPLEPSPRSAQAAQPGAPAQNMPPLDFAPPPDGAPPAMPQASAPPTAPVAEPRSAEDMASATPAGFLAHLKGKHPPLYAAVSAGKFGELQGDILPLHFAAGRETMAKLVERDTTRTKLAAVAADFFGRSVVIQPQTGEPPPPPNRQRDIDAVSALFGRENVIVEE